MNRRVVEPVLSRDCPIIANVETERKHAVVVNGKYSTACSFT